MSAAFVLLLNVLVHFGPKLRFSGGYADDNATLRASGRRIQRNTPGFLTFPRRREHRRRWGSGRRKRVLCEVSRGRSNAALALWNGALPRCGGDGAGPTASLTPLFRVLIEEGRRPTPCTRRWPFC